MKINNMKYPDPCQECGEHMTEVLETPDGKRLVCESCYLALISNEMDK